jgi:diguanylate cyclase (GGDEF)-like protein
VIEWRFETVVPLVIDIDNFYIINEQYDRGVGGGRVSQGTANYLQASLRASDVVGRLGSDAFGVLLQGSSAYEAFACAERLRNKIAQMTLDEPAGFRSTVSCGVAALQRGDSQDVWAAHAKGAVFAAKRRGRNQSIGADKIE